MVNDKYVKHIYQKLVILLSERELVNEKTNPFHIAWSHPPTLVKEIVKPPVNASWNALLRIHNIIPLDVLKNNTEYVETDIVWIPWKDNLLYALTGKAYLITMNDMGFRYELDKGAVIAIYDAEQKKGYIYYNGTPAESAPDIEIKDEKFSLKSNVPIDSKLAHEILETANKEIYKYGSAEFGVLISCDRIFVLDEPAPKSWSEAKKRVLKHLNKTFGKCMEIDKVEIINEKYGSPQAPFVLVSFKPKTQCPEISDLLNRRENKFIATYYFRG